MLGAFRQGLADGGFVEGRNVVIEFRWADGQYDRLPELAADLVRRQVSVIATPGTTAAGLAAKAATTTIPIVFGAGGDPVKLGLVASLNRPGGNATGVNFFSNELVAKRMQLLRELVPAANRIALLINPSDPANEITGLDVKAAAGDRQILVLQATTGHEIDAAFARLAREKADALFVAPGTFFNTRRVQLAILAAHHHVPAVYSGLAQVEAGGLMGYGTDLPEIYRQVGLSTARILKGVKPADLPVLQATKFQLAINLNTARALGITIPPSLLAIADDVIE
jgi:putative ABC transport system substrate-binding protein